MHAHISLGSQEEGALSGDDDEEGDGDGDRGEGGDVNGDGDIDLEDEGVGACTGEVPCDGVDEGAGAGAGVGDPPDDGEGVGDFPRRLGLGAGRSSFSLAGACLRTAVPIAA